MIREPERDPARVPEQQRRNDPEDREQDPVRLLHVRATEPVRPLDLADRERDRDAEDHEDREEILEEREPRHVAEVGERPAGVDRREHRLDDRGQQDEEAPEDERVHHAGGGLLEELALPEHVGELPASPRAGVVRARGGPRRAQDVEPRAGALPEQGDRHGQDGREGEGAQEPLRRRISSVRAGSTWNRSPTTPRSAIARSGASASLLIATIRFAPFIPTMCCKAPLIPAAR